MKMLPGVSGRRQDLRIRAGIAIYLAVMSFSLNVLKGAAGWGLVAGTVAIALLLVIRRAKCRDEAALLARLPALRPEGDLLAAGLTGSGALLVTREALISCKGWPEALVEDGATFYRDINSVDEVAGHLALRRRDGEMFFFQVRQPSIWVKEVREAAGLIEIGHS